VGEHPKYGPVVVSVAAPTDDVPQLRCLVKTKFVSSKETCSVDIVGRSVGIHSFILLS
jgi:hypothetical protein